MTSNWLEQFRPDAPVGTEVKGSFFTYRRRKNEWAINDGEVGNINKGAIHWYSRLLGGMFYQSELSELAAVLKKLNGETV